MQTFFLTMVAAIYGLLLGNYVSSAYHRIPNLKPINGLNNNVGKRPHCSSCGHDLRFYEYLPLLSWIFSRFRCNYCGAKVPAMYTVLEVSMMCSAVILLWPYSMSMEYVFINLVVAAFILNVSLGITYRKLYNKALVIMLIAILLYGVSKNVA